MSRQQRRKAQRDQKDYQVPSGPPEGEARDERIPYGARCTWWGTIYEIKTNYSNGHHLPCCPHCRGMLFEVRTLAIWNEMVQEYAEKSGDAAYPAFMDWVRTRPCQPARTTEEATASWARLRAEFDATRQQGVS